MCLDDQQMIQENLYLFLSSYCKQMHPWHLRQILKLLLLSVISYRQEYCSRKTGQNGLLLQIGTHPSASAFLLTLILWVCSAPVPHRALTLNACRTHLCRWLVGDPIHLKGGVWGTWRPPEIRAVIFTLPTTSHLWALRLWEGIMWGRQVPKTWAMWCSHSLCVVHTHFSWCLRGSTGRTLLKYP